MKTVNLQCVYEIPDDEFFWLALNQNGTVVGFRNAPIRDTALGEWIDSVTGDPGTMIQFDRWEMSVREIKDLSDIIKKGHLKKTKGQKSDMSVL
jgi:hypothetical protein